MACLDGGVLVQVHFSLIAALVPGHECEGACAGSRVHDAWMGAAWDVFCILTLTWVYHRMLQSLGKDGRVDPDLLSVLVHKLTHICTRHGAGPDTLTQWAFALPASDPERRSLPQLACSFDPSAHLPAEWAGTTPVSPTRPPPRATGQTAAGKRGERERVREASPTPVRVLRYICKCPH